MSTHPSPPQSQRPVLLTGALGFVGTHLTQLLSCQGMMPFGVDLLPKTDSNPLSDYDQVDVRKRLSLPTSVRPPDVIVNLAAVHKSPGHPAREYFETNILGARNVCRLAEETGCNHIVFTSSISVYGPGEDEKTEESLFMPNIPYGMSKVIAESIHREWQLRDPANRRLSIIRPAVVFGKGEGGNFTRIATALRKKIFAYPGRKDTIKSWIYVKDLCRLIVNRLENEDGVSVYNACYPAKTTTEDICRAFHDALGYRMPRFTVPLSALNAGAGMLNVVNTPFIRSLGLDPERIVKLVRSTNISSRKLADAGFAFSYDIVSAISDWAVDCDGRELV